MAAVQFISEKNTATTVLRKLEVKQVDNNWTLLIEDSPGADGAPAPAAPDSPPANAASLIQEANINRIEIIDI